MNKLLKTFAMTLVFALSLPAMSGEEHAAPKAELVEALETGEADWSEAKAKLINGNKSLSGCYPIKQVGNLSARESFLANCSSCRREGEAQVPDPSAKNKSALAFFDADDGSKYYHRQDFSSIVMDRDAGNRTYVVVLSKKCSNPKSIYKAYGVMGLPGGSKTVKEEAVLSVARSNLNMVLLKYRSFLQNPSKAGFKDLSDEVYYQQLNLKTGPFFEAANVDNFSTESRDEFTNIYSLMGAVLSTAQKTRLK
jgi:hypothetical protein